MNENQLIDNLNNVLSDMIDETIDGTLNLKLATINIPIDEYQNKVHIRLEFDESKQIDDMSITFISEYDYLMSIPVTFEPKYIDGSSESIEQFILNNKTQCDMVLQAHDKIIKYHLRINNLKPF